MEEILKGQQKISLELVSLALFSEYKLKIKINCISIHQQQIIQNPNQNFSFLFFTFLQCCFGFCHTRMRISHNYTYIPSLQSLSLLPHPIPQVITELRTGLPVLHSSSPAIHLTPDSVYMLMLLSPFIPLSPPPLCPQVHSLHLRLPSFPADRFLNTIFLDFIYMCYIRICFSLSDLIGSRFIHLTRTDLNSFFLWLSNIPLYICTTSSLSIHLSMDI